MKGLKTQESKSFKNFFALVQKVAQNRNAIFFLEAGDGRDFKEGDIEGEDLQGWLIPNEKIKEFEPEWKNNKVTEKWEKYFCFAVWNKEGDKIKIKLQ